MTKPRRGAGSLCPHARLRSQGFQALIGAGKAALEIGDAQAAAGFFARADEVNPRSPLPQAGMGAVSVANGEPQAALPYFKRAQQLGAPLATFGCDRGLAYDLLGQQAQAQADYRAALGGRDGDEARRRLALSLAISGDRAGALQTLGAAVGQGRCRRAARPRFRAGADRRFQRRDDRDQRGDARQLGAASRRSCSGLPALPPGRRPRP